MPPAPDSARISPTAFYTAQVWHRAGWSERGLGDTWQGRVLHGLVRPMNLAYERFGRTQSLDQMLHARHAALDGLLVRDIEAGRVGQLVELPGGLSPRAIVFARRYPHLRVVEADLPGMIARKREALARAGLSAPNHTLVEVDAFVPDGRGSVTAMLDALDPAVGTCVITEGLLGYFDRAHVESLWTRLATGLRRFPFGVYRADLNIAGDIAGMRTATLFRWGLSAFARGRVHLHWDTDAAVEAALRDCGFAHARAARPRDWEGLTLPGGSQRALVRVIEATA